MAEQDRYIPGVPCWIDASEPDPQAAAEFYAGLFGWEIEDVMPPESPVRYLVGRRGGGDVAALASAPEDGPRTAVWNTYVWVEDADEAAAKAQAAGGTVLAAPRDVGEDGRMAVLADPAGAAFRVWQARRHRGATVVNEHGALNFNDLVTPDLEAAQAFYGAVFGWELLGTGTEAMWALPGYGDFLEARRPGLREQMAAMGAPERFEDVVASVRVIGPDEAHVSPRWGVTFAVDDADVVAARATELGGEVVVPPFDVPWVRMAVVRDPQGAEFVAGQFVPESAGQPEEATAGR